jgi:hypothetical protein
MEIIKFDTVGFINSGKKAGFYIKVLFDEKDTGGYYFLTCKNKNFTGEVFDAWFEDYIKLEKYFKETGTVVNWNPSDVP